MGELGVCVFGDFLGGVLFVVGKYVVVLVE